MNNKEQNVNKKIPTATNEICVTGAREHNLRNITVSMPRNALVVITGLSGSGKSSLAFDTIYAEGQRRYVESLSAYARQFLEMQEKPDVDSITGLSPAISIEQKTTSRNPRSTVGTVTEIYDYMRLLWARVGVPYSPATGLPIESQSVSQMVDRILEMEEGARLYLLAPLVRGRKGEYKKELAELLKKGFQRVKIDGEFYELDETPLLDKKVKHDIYVVVDRLVLRADMGNRLADSIETALALSDEGLLIIEDAKTGDETLFSEKFACPVSGFTIEEIEPRLFSFNNPFGACPNCDGLGTTYYFDPEMIVPDESKTLAGGAVAPWANSSSKYAPQTLASIAAYCKTTVDTPWCDLPKKAKNMILNGSGKVPITISFDDGRRSYKTHKPFEGLLPNMKRRWLETDSNWVRDDLKRYQSVMPCTSCKGRRLKPEALAVKIAGEDIGAVTHLSIKDAQVWFADLPEKLDAQRGEIASRILKEISERLGFLNNVGLGYISLSRTSGTLSGGESQRIRLASQIGSGLSGVLYVLDEPSIGLHQRDNDRLLVMLKRLRDLENTVIVVEHDEDAIRSADYLIDIGPGAGIHGGEIVAAGTPEEVLKCKRSLTAAYLTGQREIPLPKKRRKGNGKFLEVKKATGNNLKSISVKFPLGVFTCITGVSGSGKSTLTLDTLYQVAAKKLMRARTHPAPYKEILGLEHLDKVIDIDQGPIGRTPRSNPATYIGAFTPIRDWFTKLPESKLRGYNAGRFSFNVKGGRCESCRGDGVIKIEMHFLPDIYVTCENCKGKRYNRETLEVLFKGKNIADILDMTVEEGTEFFKDMPAVFNKLKTLNDVGLGYIKIGQRATTLSGGEAQRVKLAKELSKRATGRTLYILDEPTTGLHFEDVRKLLEVLHHLVNQGNSILVIEHNLEVIKTADWIIDLGPEGGDEGGEIIAVGTPEKVAKTKKSYTGAYLLPYLKMKARKKALVD